MKVLIIEDDTFFQKFYRHKLEELGHTVEVGVNGEEGIAKAQSFLPDIVLLDLIMPVKDGFEVLRTLRADEKFKNTPILVFSTLGLDSDVQKAKEFGASDFVNKSFFNMEVLVEKIQQLTGNLQPKT